MLKPLKASTWARVIPLLAVVASLVLAALGCGGDDAVSGGPETASAGNEKVTLTDRTGTFTFASDTAPVNLAIDPDVWLLAEFGAFEKK